MQYYRLQACRRYDSLCICSRYRYFLISAYKASGAVCQSAGALTLFEIMRQKLIAMGINTEIWNDMRRLDYSKVYVDY